MPETLRMARAQVAVGASSGNVTPLALPDRVGEVVVPQFLHFYTQHADATNALIVGLSHYLNLANPGDQAGILINPSVWCAAALEYTMQRDLDWRGFELELAGPQQFWVFNASGITMTVTCLMYYFMRRVSHIEWARIKRATSFEDL